MRRIIVKGGIISPSELSRVVDLAEAANLTYLALGSRQDIILPLKPEHESLLPLFPSVKFIGEGNDKFQNIVCSYVSTDIFTSTAWLKGTNFLYLLEQFNKEPTLRINITDPRRRLVPLFSSLNYVASDMDDYWPLCQPPRLG